MDFWMVGEMRATVSIIGWCRSSTVTLVLKLFQKSRVKRDGPVFFSTAPAKVTGDERTIMAIDAPHRGGTSHTTRPLFGRANLPVCPN
jgi:hypothetical protein